MSKFRKIVEDTLSHTLGQFGINKNNLNKAVNICILSANRKDKSAEENYKNYGELQKIVRQMGYGFTVTKGGYPENGKTSSEPSIKIVDRYDNPEKFLRRMIALGAKFEQDNILVKLKNEDKPKYITTTTRIDSTTGNLHKIDDIEMEFDTVKQANPNKDAYWTKVGNRYFKFEAYEDINNMFTLTEEEIEKYAPITYSKYGRNFDTYSEAHIAYNICRKLGLEGDDALPSWLENK